MVESTADFQEVYFNLYSLYSKRDKSGRQWLNGRLLAFYS